MEVTAGDVEDGGTHLKKLPSKGNVQVAVTVISESGQSSGLQVFEVDSRPYRCENCHKVFRNNGALHTHMNKCGNRGRPSKATPQYQCTICCRMFKNNGALHTHMRSHDSVKQNSVVKSGAVGYARALRTRSGGGGEREWSSQSDNKDGEESAGYGKTEKDVDIAIHPVSEMVVADTNSLEDNAGCNGETIDAGSKLSGAEDEKPPEPKRSMRKHEKFSCSVCGRQFESRGGLLCHQQDHAGESSKVFGCQRCGKVFGSNAALEKHAQTHAGDDGKGVERGAPLKHKCAMCQQEFRLKASLAKHIKQRHIGHSLHKNNKLCVVQQAVGDKSDGSKWKNKKTKKFVCRICGKDFEFKSLLARHMATHSKEVYKPRHTSNRVMTCNDLPDHSETCKPNSIADNSANQFNSNVCDDTFHSEEADLQNRQGHFHVQDENVYKCKTCGKLFQDKERLSRHALLHRPRLGPKSYPCPVCLKSFSNAYVLRHHMTSHGHGHPYRCSPCNKLFPGPYSHQVHLEAHRAKPYRCEVCGWRMRRKASYTKHQLMHQRQGFQSSLCLQSFVKRLDLTKHNKLHHSSQLDPHREAKESQDTMQGVDNDNQELKTTAMIDKNVNTLQDSKLSSTTCPVCHKVLANRKSLRGHLRVHQGETFRCDFCPKSFNRLYTLRSHLKVIHRKVLCNTKQGLEGEIIKLEFSNQVLFKCPVCGFVFIHRKELVGHMRIHTGQKPYECSSCLATFNGRFQLQEHLVSWHPEVSLHRKKDARHLCVLCDKAFVKRCDLKRHLKVHQKHGHSLPAIVV